jgi:putative transposase
MARLARVVAVGVPHHVTQRGNARQFILACDADRSVYLDLLRQSIALHGVELIGYCLMSNHVHLIALPHQADGLGLALKNAQGRYASYWNASHHSTGHVWQGDTIRALWTSSICGKRGSAAVYGAESGACRYGGHR